MILIKHIERMNELVYYINSLNDFLVLHAIIYFLVELILCSTQDGL